jgi:hypothetical protein
MAFIRVSRSNPCPICNKPDWCLVSTDKQAAICARVASTKRCGQSSAGWLHVLNDEPLSRWRTVHRPKPKRPLIEIQEVQRRCLADCTIGHLNRLSSRLGVSVGALQSIRVGYNIEKHSWSFPMLDESGRVVGIRYRSSTGKKWSERGSREGLFYRPEFVTDSVVIVEGASDVAALLTIGQRSVVGRANCNGNIDQLRNLCQRKNIRRALIIPDNDQPGLNGADRLAEALRDHVDPIVLTLPAGIKDCRCCITQKENADWLAGQVGKIDFPVTNA